MLHYLYIITLFTDCTYTERYIRMSKVQVFQNILIPLILAHLSAQNLTLKRFNPKKAWGGGGVKLTPPPVVFLKMYLLKRRWNTGFL